MHSISPMLIPIVAILMPLILAPMLTILKHRHHREEWRHLERMRSIEHGLPSTTGQALGQSFAVAAIGLGVPFFAVLGAFLTSIVVPAPSPLEEIPIAVVAWGCAMLISMGALATSVILTVLSLRAARETRSQMASDHRYKPAYDPDAYDVVSSRG